MGGIQVGQGEDGGDGEKERKAAIRTADNQFQNQKRHPAVDVSVARPLTHHCLTYSDPSA